MDKRQADFEHPAIWLKKKKKKRKSSTTFELKCDSRLPNRVKLALYKYKEPTEDPGL